MKIRLLKSILFSFSFLVVITSCNKIEDIPARDLRGGNSLVLAPDGNLIVAGYKNSSTKGYEAALLKVNAETGAIMWDAEYGNTYSDAFYSVKNAHGGGFIAAGFSNSVNASSPSMLAVITDANGNALHTKTYGGSAYSQAFSLIPAADSGYVLAGYIQKTSISDRDIYLVKIDNAGDTLWTSIIGAKSTDQYDSVNDAAYGIITAPDGGFFLTGSLNTYSNYGGRIFLMKVSSTGKQLWTKTFGYGIGFSLTLTHENGVANGVAVSGSLQEGSSQDVFLLKTDIDGKMVWTGIKTFGGSGFEYGATMVEAADGGFAISGITDSKGYGNNDVYLIHTDRMGENPWEKTFGGTDNDHGFGLVGMPDNSGFSITGLSNSGGSYIFVNRTSNDGTEKWVKYIE